jgi:hypothetical protein
MTTAINLRINNVDSYPGQITVSLKNHSIPRWIKDDKFGINTHWKTFGSGS